MTEEHLRVMYLKEAARLTSDDRNKQYGEPWDNLTSTAELITAYLVNKYSGKTLDTQQFRLTGEDIAHFMVLTKMARTFHGAPKADTYIDGACYFAIAGECASIDSED